MTKKANGFLIFLLVAGFSLFVSLCQWGGLFLQKQGQYTDKSEGSEKEVLTTGKDYAFSEKTAVESDEKNPEETASDRPEKADLPDPGAVSDRANETKEQLLSEIDDFSLTDGMKLISLTQKLRDISPAMLVSIMTEALKRAEDSFPARRKIMTLASGTGCACLSEFWRDILHRKSETREESKFVVFLSESDQVPFIPAKRQVYGEQMFAIAEISRLVKKRPELISDLKEIIADPEKVWYSMLRQLAYDLLRKHDSRATAWVLQLDSEDSLRLRLANRKNAD